MAIFHKQTISTAGKSHPQPQKNSLLDAVGLKVGQAIVWEHGNVPESLTERERRLICQRLNVKRINEARCLQIKRLSATLSCAKIVEKFKGKRGYSESYITKVHAALSAAKGEGQ
jgi:hypothetical protein